MNARAIVALALIVGVAGGVVLAAVAGARRTSSAYPRFVEYVGTADVSVGTGPSFQGEFPARKIEALPMVEVAGELAYAFLTVDGADAFTEAPIVPFAAGDHDQYRTIDRGIIVDGRRPDPDRVDEIAISPEARRNRGWAPGTEVGVQLPSAADIAAAISGKEFLPLEGPHVTLRVAGVLRQPSDLIALPDLQDVVYLGGAQMMYLTPAFFEAHVRPVIGEPSGMSIRLRGGPADLDAFRAAIAALPNGREIGVQPAEAVDAQVRGAIDLQASALLLFAALAGLASFAIIGQALARHVALGASDHQALRSIGMSGPQLVLGATVHGAVIGAGGAALAVIVAALASPLAPFGFARQAEPFPGFQMNVAVITLGAVAIALLIAGRTALAGIRAIQRSSRVSARANGETRPLSAVARVIGRVGASPAAVTGVRTALVRGMAPVPVTGSLAGLVVAVTALVASFGFGASLQRLADSPEAYGWNWDVIVGNPNNIDTVADTVPRLAASSVVGSFAPMTNGSQDISIDGTIVGAAGIDTSHGAIFPVMSAGAPPTGPNELAVGTKVSRRLRLRVGQTVSVAAGGRALPMRISGITVRGGDQSSGTTGGGSPGEGAILTMGGLRSLLPEAPASVFLVRFPPGVDHRGALASLQRDFPLQVLQPIVPAEVQSLVRIGWIPYALAALLGALGLATLAHTLITAVRRRTRELAVLKTLGFLRRQVSATVAWHATALIVAALAIGVPAGIAGARWSWRVVSDGTGVTFLPVTPALPILAVAVAALVIGNLLAGVPGAMAARVRPADALREE